MLVPPDDDCAKNAADFVRNIPGDHGNRIPQIGVILGSGLGPAADRLLQQGGLAIPFSVIPGMPITHVSGHAGRLVLGRIGGATVAMLQGRAHFYEGHATSKIQFGTRLLSQLGIRRLIVTNAAGGIRRSFSPGDLMLINSHLRPLAAKPLDFAMIQNRPCDFGTDASTQMLWSPSLRAIARNAATSLNVHEGVYAMMTGPTYETPAEIRMMEFLGADAVGMSTVPEAILAASCGIETLGVSCITNVAAGLSEGSLDHAEVTATASSVETEFVDWLWRVVSRMADD